MINRKQYEQLQELAAEMMRKAGIAFSESERSSISVNDFGLGNPYLEGAQILTFFDSPHLSAKVIALLPGQTLPEHWHPRIGEYEGKEEVIRVICGELYLYTDGPENIQNGQIPEMSRTHYSVKHETVLLPHQQMILPPGTRHWFQAGKEGTVMYSLSTTALDLQDCFTDPRIVRETVIGCTITGG